ncbi:hypothetical protein F7725_022341 [Dissostichus mawsoni]|uniref:CCHC-type domain-containing protein n=1 Tax=Dissostichus mawsoni TaxID=36200 RepID=A0A7J5YY05_DISMA|nr:hypothetical protein F7725_022341 [Dissostichus mawsoni]
MLGGDSDGAAAAPAAQPPQPPQLQANANAPPSATFTIQPPEAFDFAKPQDWDRWIRRFERFRLASNLHLSTEANQVNTLIYCMGDEADDILRGHDLSDAQRQQYTSFPHQPMHPSTKPQPSSDRQSCYRCGKSPGHANTQCPAREVTCHACGKRGRMLLSVLGRYRESLCKGEQVIQEDVYVVNYLNVALLSRPASVKLKLVYRADSIDKSEMEESYPKSASVDYRYKVSRHSGFVALSSTFYIVDGPSGTIRRNRHHLVPFPETVPHTPHTPTPSTPPQPGEPTLGSPERPESPKQTPKGHTPVRTHTHTALPLGTAEWW